MMQFVIHRPYLGSPSIPQNLWLLLKPSRNVIWSLKRQTSNNNRQNSAVSLAIWYYMYMWSNFHITFSIYIILYCHLTRPFPYYSLFTFIMSSKLWCNDFICNIVYSLMSYSYSNVTYTIKNRKDTYIKTVQVKGSLVIRN